MANSSVTVFVRLARAGISQRIVNKSPSLTLRGLFSDDDRHVNAWERDEDQDENVVFY
jgi:hypothetical protein